MSTYQPRHRRVRSGWAASGIRAVASGLFAAATAICALGFLTIPTPAQAVPCKQYGFNGNFSLIQSNGATVTFRSTSQAVQGSARASGTGANGDGVMLGNVTGRIDGTTVDFTIRWNDGPIGRYLGRVNDGDFATGFTQDQTNLDSTATWKTTVPLACITPPAAPDPVSATPPQLTVYVKGPEILQAGASGLYNIRVTNNGDTAAPAEVIVIFSGKLAQWGGITAGGGVDCLVQDKTRLRCATPEARGKTDYDIQVRGHGSDPGEGSLLAYLGETVGEVVKLDNSYQLNVAIT